MLIRSLSIALLVGCEPPSEQAAGSAPDTTDAVATVAPAPAPAPERWRSDSAIAGFDQLLAFVPGDSAYLWAATAKLDERDLLLRYDEWSPFFEAQALSVQSALYQAEWPFASLAGSALEQLRGRWHREGFDALGLLTTPRFAFFAIGLYPALRLELADVDRFELALRRVEVRAGLSPDYLRLHGLPVRVYSQGDWRLLVALSPSECLLTAVPASQLDAAAAVLLSRVPLSQSLEASRRLAALTTSARPRFGADAADPTPPSALGAVDLQALAGLLASAAESGDTAASCAHDLERIARVTPRLRFASWQNASAQSGLLEFDLSAPEELAALRRSWPTTPDQPAATLELGVGLDLEAVFDGLQAWQLAQRSEAFRCPPLAAGVEALQPAWRRFRALPTPLLDAEGGWLRIDRLELGATGLRKLEGVLAFTSENPASALQELASALGLEAPPLKKKKALSSALFTELPPWLDGLTVASAKRMLVFAAGSDSLAQAQSLAAAKPEEGQPLLELSLDYSGGLASLLPEQGPDEEALRRGVREHSRSLERFLLRFDLDGSVARIGWRIGSAP